KFGFSNRTILQTHGREPLQLSPFSASEALLKVRKVANADATRDRLDSVNLTDDLEWFRRHATTPPCPSDSPRQSTSIQPLINAATSIEGPSGFLSWAAIDTKF